MAFLVKRPLIHAQKAAVLRIQPATDVYKAEIAQ